MILSAIQSIKNDFSRSLFYWFTFVLTSMFMFLFFHLSYSDMVGVTFIHSQKNMATNLTIIVLVICMIVIFFANDFYVKKKSKAIAVMLMSGGTYLQIVQYLLFQTFILFIFAIPIGIFCSLAAIPFINEVLINVLHSQGYISIRLDAMISTTIILGFEIIWCTILNLGYTYRCSIKTLLDNEHTKIVLKIPTLYKFNIPIHAVKIISLLLFVGPVLLFYMSKDDLSSLLFYSMIGMIGLYLSIHRVFIPWLNENIQIKWIDQKLKMIYCGLLRSDLMLLKKNIILFIVSDILILAMMSTSLQNVLDILLSLLSFVVMNILLSLSILLNYANELPSRKKVFQALQKIGYTKDDQKKIILYEVLGLYGFILVVALFYILNMMIVLMLHSFLNIQFIMVIMILFIVPLIICCLISYLYYKRLLRD